MSKEKLINKIFSENRNILQEIMNKKGISEEQIKSELICYLNNKNVNLYRELNNGEQLQIKEINESLPVKIGWYEILGNPNPELFVEKCTLIPTEKMMQIYP